MIARGDGIRLEVEFTADAVRAKVAQFIDERAADLKAMVGKFCDELAGQNALEVIEERIKRRVEETWRIALEEFIRNEAQGQVYEQIQKLRVRLAQEPKKRGRKAPR